MQLILFFVLILFSYFLGNIHFAKIVSKVIKEDITKHGSGNPGTMNMLRTYGFSRGLITLFLDSAKGAIPAILGFYLFGGIGGGYTAIYVMHVAGMISVIGHVFPVIYKFKGGKGVATALGYFTVVNPLLSLIVFVVAFLVFVFTKLGSLGSLVYVLGFLIVSTAINFNVSYLIPFISMLIIVVLVYVSHYNNIVRIVKNQESKIDIKETIIVDKKRISEKKSNKNKEVN